MSTACAIVLALIMSPEMADSKLPPLKSAWTDRDVGRRLRGASRLAPNAPTNDPVPLGILGGRRHDPIATAYAADFRSLGAANCAGDMDRLKLKPAIWVESSQGSNIAPDHNLRVRYTGIWLSKDAHSALVTWLCSYFGDDRPGSWTARYARLRRVEGRWVREAEGHYGAV